MVSMPTWSRSTGWPLLWTMAALGTIVLMLGITATANFGWFNLLTAALCLPLRGVGLVRIRHGGLGAAPHGRAAAHP